MEKGFFITFEGPEGSGKTTIIEMIEKRLQSEGKKVLKTREPGGIPIAEQIREIILDKENTKMDSRTEALLYAAARRQHLVEKVQPALAEGYIVLCDRFVDSSLAYQGHARGLGMEKVYQINQFAIGELMPDLTFLLDIDPETGLKRISKNNEREVNRLDLESLSFHKKVREGYIHLLEQFPERIVKINASNSIEQVCREIYDQIHSLIVK